MAITTRLRASFQILYFFAKSSSSVTIEDIRKTKNILYGQFLTSNTMAYSSNVSGVPFLTYVPVDLCFLQMGHPVCVWVAKLLYFLTQMMYYTWYLLN